MSDNQLKSFIERIERLAEEKQSFQDDIKNVYAELKGAGYDAKAVREVIKIRKKDRNQRREEEAVLETYKNALGID